MKLMDSELIKKTLEEVDFYAKNVKMTLPEINENVEQIIRIIRKARYGHVQSNKNLV